MNLSPQAFRLPIPFEAYSGWTTFQRRLYSSSILRRLLILSVAVIAWAQENPSADPLLESRHQNPDHWLSYDRDNSGRRYSSLKQIHSGNIGRLAVEWVFQFQTVPLRSEATPIVRDGVMYFTVGGTEAVALDAKTGRMLWRFQYPLEVASRPNWNRGLAISGNRLFMGTVDCYLLALDARNGSLLWKTLITDEQPCFAATAAPLIVKNRVIIGTRGGDTGRLRGAVSAYDAETGERAWRFWTIPAPGEAGSETWPDNDSWKAGGGAPWITPTYDPNLNLLYVPTGNPGPKDFDGSDREGDNLYTATLLALNPDNGKRIWHFQFTPHDVHDWDATETPMLVDTIWQDKPRKLILQANRNGFFYVLDRTNGEFLRAEPFAKQTWAERIDEKGRPVVIPDSEPSNQGTLVCPDIHGGTNWHGVSFSPAAGLFYVAARDACGIYYRTGHSIDHDMTEDVKQVFRAIDIQTGKIAWEMPFLGDANKQINLAGSMSTAGGLVFFSSRIGRFIAANAKTGKVLWNVNLGGSIRASPMTYSVEGKQYVALTSKNAVFTFALR